jgi:hypothetical protein
MLGTETIRFHVEIALHVGTEQGRGEFTGPVGSSLRGTLSNNKTHLSTTIQFHLYTAFNSSIFPHTPTPTLPPTHKGTAGSHTDRFTI